MNLAVTQLQHPIGQSQFVHDMQDGGMDRVAAKIAIEIFVRFKQRHRNPLTRQQKGEHGAARTGPDNAAGCFDRVEHLMPTVARFVFLRVSGFSVRHNLMSDKL